MTVSREQIEWCYRLLLGREPESERVIRERLPTANRLDLLQSFLESDEFQRKSPEYRSTHSALNRYGGRPLQVEVEVAPEQFAGLWRRVKECWTRLGETQPHWSVMSDEQFRPASIESSEARFWASGAAPVKALQCILDRVGLDRLQDKTCVEYGCGMGRMTGHLAPLFGQVDGYDISASHLRHAQTRLERLGRVNVRLHLVGEDPLFAIAPCDVYYSRIVLQHNPPPLIRELLIRGLRALRPGGVAVFQVATHFAGYRFDIEEYLAAPPDAANEFEIHCFPQPEVYRLLAGQGCELLEVHEDGAAGQPGICVSNLFVARKVPSAVPDWRSRLRRFGRSPAPVNPR